MKMKEKKEKIFEAHFAEHERVHSFPIRKSGTKLLCHSISIFFFILTFDILTYTPKI